MASRRANRLDFILSIDVIKSAKLAKLQKSLRAHKQQQSAADKSAVEGSKKVRKELDKQAQSTKKATRAKKAATTATDKQARSTKKAAKEQEKFNQRISATDHALGGLRRILGSLRNQILVVLFATRALRESFGKAFNATLQMESALRGLGTVAINTGNNMSEAKMAALSLAADGLISIQDASAGLKNLLATQNFTLQQSVDIMNTLIDSAAFNRQGTLKWGEAVVGATQGIKNQNCNASNSLIFNTLTRSYETIKEVVERGEPFYTISYNEDTGELEYGLVTDFFFNGYQPIVKIITSSGKELEVTEDHRIYTKRGWIEAGDLIVGEDEILAVDNHTETIQNNKECLYCKKHFHVKPSKMERKKFCSFQCKNNWYKENGSNGPDPNIDCDICGNSFYKKPFKLEKDKNHFCSLECKGKYWTENYVGKNGVNYQYGRDELINYNCDLCENEFQIEQYKIKREVGDHHFCSEKCLSIFRQGLALKNDSLKTRGFLKGVENRSKELGVTSREYLKWRRAILKKDNNTCRKCGSKENLHVHHGISVKERPDLGIDLNNGITLCSSCHNETHKSARLFKQSFEKVVSVEEVGEDKVYDLTIEKNHNFMSNWMIVHNCLAYDTRIYDPVRGETRTIEEWHDADIVPCVLSVNRQTGEMEVIQAEYLHYNGINEVFEIELENGSTIEATANHRFLTQDGFKFLEDLDLENDLLYYVDEDLIEEELHNRKIVDSDFNSLYIYSTNNNNNLEEEILCNNVENVKKNCQETLLDEGGEKKATVKGAGLTQSMRSIDNQVKSLADGLKLNVKTAEKLLSLLEKLSKKDMGFFVQKLADQKITDDYSLGKAVHVIVEELRRYVNPVENSCKLPLELWREERNTVLSNVVQTGSLKTREEKTTQVGKAGDQKEKEDQGENIDSGKGLYLNALGYDVVNVIELAKVIITRIIFSHKPSSQSGEQNSQMVSPFVRSATEKCIREMTILLKNSSICTPTPLKIVKISSKGTTDTYDLSVSPNFNFVGNYIIQSNSIMVDNAGITKNLSIMYKEYAATIGSSIGKLTEGEKAQAIYNGLMREGAIFSGDAAKAMDTLNGRLTVLGTESFKTSALLGEILTGGINAVVKELLGVTLQTRSYIEENKALLKQDVASWGRKIGEALKIVATGVRGLTTGVTALLRIFDGSLVLGFIRFIALNKVFTKLKGGGALVGYFKNIMVATRMMGTAAAGADVAFRGLGVVMKRFLPIAVISAVVEIALAFRRARLEAERLKQITKDISIGPTSLGAGRQKAVGAHIEARGTISKGKEFGVDVTILEAAKKGLQEIGVEFSKFEELNYKQIQKLSRADKAAYFERVEFLKTFTQEKIDVVRAAGKAVEKLIQDEQNRITAEAKLRKDVINAIIDSRLAEKKILADQMKITKAAADARAKLHLDFLKRRDERKQALLDELRMDKLLADIQVKNDLDKTVAAAKVNAASAGQLKLNQLLAKEARKKALLDELNMDKLLADIQVKNDLDLSVERSKVDADNRGQIRLNQLLAKEERRKKLLRDLNKLSLDALNIELRSAQIQFRGETQQVNINREVRRAEVTREIADAQKKLLGLGIPLFRLEKKREFLRKERISDHEIEMELLGVRSVMIGSQISAIENILKVEKHLTVQEKASLKVKLALLGVERDYLVNTINLKEIAFNKMLKLDLAGLTDKETAALGKSLVQLGTTAFDGWSNYIKTLDGVKQAFFQFKLDQGVAMHEFILDQEALFKKQEISEDQLNERIAAKRTEQARNQVAMQKLTNVKLDIERQRALANLTRDITREITLYMARKMAEAGHIVGALAILAIGLAAGGAVARKIEQGTNQRLAEAQAAFDIATKQNQMSFDQESGIQAGGAASTKKFGGTIKAEKLEVNISPTVIIQGDQIFIGGGSVHEFSAELASLQLETMQAAIDNREITLDNLPRN